MAKKPDLFGVSGNDTVIGSSVKLKGNLSSENDITIDGRMAGNVKSGGHVTVGVNAHVTGNIDATSATIGGRVDGNVRVLDFTQILESGQVYGDIDTTRLEVGMGAVFIGASKMKAPSASEVADRESVEESAR
jgi:cytoskeletal protein CcmA (bactofilin family)